MSLRTDRLSQNIEQLSRMVVTLDAENADLKAEVACLKDLIHGAKSEKLSTIDSIPIALDLGDLSGMPAAANDDVLQIESGGRQGRRSPARNIGFLPKRLPRYDVIIGSESTLCPCCASKLRCIGEDTVEALDMVPAIIRVKRTIRPRYACRVCQNGVVQMPASLRFMGGGMATTALAAHVAVSKYAWHLPLYRQAQILQGYGISIDRGTLGVWVTRVAWWLEPLYHRLPTFIRSQQRVFCDETLLPQLEPGRKRIKVCQLWALAIDDRPFNGPAPPAVGYVFSAGGSAREVEGQLHRSAAFFRWMVIRAYTTLAKRRGMSNSAPLHLAFCLAHARRKFVGAVKLTEPSEAPEIVAHLAEVYRIEATIRGESAEACRELRQQQTAPILKTLKARLIVLKEEVSTKSALAKAITYTLNHWSGLVAFLDVAGSRWTAMSSSVP